LLIESCHHGIVAATYVNGVENMDFFGHFTSSSSLTVWLRWRIKYNLYKKIFPNENQSALSPQYPWIEIIMI